ncbi:MAG TPA: PAS domain S-box protein [Rhizobiaceae bacterium]|nr:PAS domain S-box protein [Rhizobiaceae bacterium]
MSDPEKLEVTDGQRLEIAARAASLGIWDWNLLTDEMIYSDRAREICGFPAEGPITFQMVSAVTHREDLPRTRELARRSLDPLIRANETYEYRIVRADTGETRWVRAHGEAVFTEIDGEILAVRYVGTIQDITNRKKAADALAASEARLRLAVEASGMAVWEVDLATETVTHSPELNRLCGFPPDARPTLEEFRARYAPGEQERIRQEGQEVLARGETMMQTEFRQIWPDGSEHWLLMRAQIAPGSGGTGQRVIGVLFDVTERKRAEEVFREMADNAPVMVWVTDPDDNCTFMSRSWYEFTGQAPGDALGRGWLNCVHPEDFETTEKASRISVEERTPFRAEYRLRRHDGEWRWVLDVAAPRYDKAGRFLGHIGSVIDITERYRDEERRSLLVSELNHRLKNSLAIVQTIASQTFRGIEEASGAVSAFAGRLRALADANEIGLKDNAATVSLGEVVLRITAPYREGVSNPFDICGDDILMSSRIAVAVGMALHELSTNAVKYGSLSVPSGRVAVEWRQADKNRVEIVWTESGGPEVAKPERLGFGSRLIERGVLMGVRGKAEIAYEPAGLVCRMEVPISEAAPA